MKKRYVFMAFCFGMAAGIVVAHPGDPAAYVFGVGTLVSLAFYVAVEIWV